MKFLCAKNYCFCYLIFAYFVLLVGFYLFCVFSVAKISLKKLNKQKTVLITSFTILLTSYISGKKFPNSKNEKNPLWKNVLYFREWNFLVPNLKNLLYFRRKLAKSQNQKKKCLVRENLLNVSTKGKKVSYTFPYKQVKFSKSKHFLIIIIKSFFSFYNILYSTSFCFSSSKRFF